MSVHEITDIFSMKTTHILVLPRSKFAVRYIICCGLIIDSVIAFQVNFENEPRERYIQMLGYDKTKLAEKVHTTRTIIDNIIDYVTTIFI